MHVKLPYGNKMSLYILKLFPEVKPMS